MSLTEKTDIRDSDEKVVEIEMERLDKKKCSSQFTLSSDCIRRFCEKYREARIILISSWKNGFISSHNEKNTPQIKELEGDPPDFCRRNGFQNQGTEIYARG